MVVNFLVALASVSLHFALTNALVSFPSKEISIRHLFNNQAASSDGSADFDGRGSSYDSQYLPHGPWLYDGIQYDLPSSWGGHPDNVIANGQILSFSQPTYVHELHLLFAGDGTNGEFVREFELNFADNTNQSLSFLGKSWWRFPILDKGSIEAPHHFELNGTRTNMNATHIFQWSTSISSEKPLKSLTLPTLNPSNRLHIFAISFSPCVLPGTRDPGPALSVRRVRFTSRWELIDGVRAQAVEVTLANLLPSSSLSRQTSITSPHVFDISGSNIRTLAKGNFYRLVPGDQIQADVLVTGSRTGVSSSVRISDIHGKVIGSSGGWAASPLVERWTDDLDQLSSHETPTWWNKAKYGIFIHWGVYSYPAWAPPSSYAEWYNWDLHNPPTPGNPTWDHHFATYGKDVVYDDFIPKFTASKFNASAWLDLFDRAGAKYFVIVTKHHDGFALFETGNTTHRSSVYLGPKRDLVAELFETAEKEKPNIHRGTYYSLPEWFNPDSARYGFGSWPGGLARNAFNASEVEPYTGRLNISDYIDDLQYPHMLDLALKYDTEIMWCDIGGPNRTPQLAAQFYNHAMSTGRQVTLNNRCGAVPDFDTPEYATFGAIQPRKWETNEGMDPFSYGLNSATNASQYKNGTTIIQTLVDVVSKNGNFLLDIGPTAEGEIITPMANNLLDAGAWLKYSGECVYDTEYWFPGSQDIDPISGSPPARFLTTATTFCIVAFSQPKGGQLVINKRVPILPGDTVTLLKPSQSAAEASSLAWSVDRSGKLTIKIPEAEARQVKYAWAFQVKYNTAI